MKIFWDLNTLPAFELPSVLTIGSFDGVHHGHQKLLQRLNFLANEIGGQSVVITFEPHPRQIIYPKDDTLRLLTTLEEKIRYISAEAVDILVVVPFTVEFSQLQPREYIESFLIAQFNPRFIVIGYDHRFGMNREGNFALLKSYEKTDELEIIEIDKQSVEEIVVSSTKIRKAVSSGNIQLANKLLNHPYPIHGTIVHGEKIGSRLGFPTANIAISNNSKLIPKVGIYAATIMVDESPFEGLLYVGRRPTVENNEELRLEMHILDYNELIYDKEVIVELHEYLRADANFQNLDALRTQMIDDEKKARLFFEKKAHLSQSKVSKVAVAILNYNGKQFLQKFLPSVVQHLPDPATIYVIDNGSTDGSLELLNNEFPTVNQIRLDKNYGYAGGYNKGLEQIKADYYYLINSDIGVEEQWLMPLLNMCERDPLIAACQPKILAFDNPEKFEYAGGAGGYMDATYYPFCMGRILNDTEIDHGQYDSPVQIFWASGAALFIRAQVFQKLGGFDASFFAHQEEIDLCWRIRRAGFKIMSCPQAKVYHLGGGTLTYESPQKTYLNFRNNLATMYKNLPTLKFFSLFPVRFLLDSAAAANYLLRGQTTNAGQVFKAYGKFIANLSALRKTKMIEEKRIKKISSGPTNLEGIHKRSILIDYYFRNRRTFTALGTRQTPLLNEGKHTQNI